MKKIKDKDFQSFLNELTWNEIKKEDFTKSKTDFIIKVEK
jgi:hypothetical protein